MDKKLQAVIKYVVDISSVDNITPKKLQKLLYYIQSWHLALNAENDSAEELESSLIFKEKFEAWVHGPVIPEVYIEYKGYGSSSIDTSGFDINYETVLSRDEIATINEVLDIYGGFDGNELEVLTHNEQPWIEARGDLTPLESSNKHISNKTVFNFYGEKLV